ncbi:isoprenoid synthase domain-containing protein [Aspergillus ambiguus]|uniref:terpene synthase family protein n=1 Tax=Aspergillus ambiguus TaxID=176160 RepID=UPI003CCE1860
MVSETCPNGTETEVTNAEPCADEISRLSVPVPCDFYVSKPDYFSNFKPRIHRDNILSADASIQCQIDLFGKDRLGMVMGNLDTYCGDWTALVYPFCDPERLALAAYMVDFAFIHDDVDYKETIQTRKFESDSEIRDKALRTGNYTPAFLDESRNKQVIAKTMCKLIELDSKRGIEFIQQWENWKQSEKDYVEHEAQKCDTLDRFLTLCYYMRGCQWANGMARFAYKLTLTGEEEQLVTPLTQLIMNVLTLHNDYFSWDKENEFYNSSEEKLPMSNAVTLYMKWYSMSVEDAKDAIRAVAVQKEQEYLQKKEKFLGEQPVSPAIMRWLNIMEHMVSGNLLWSLTCPRYHRKPNNQYVDYYELRCRQGYAFPDDCSILDGFVGYQPINKDSSGCGEESPTNGQDRYENAVIDLHNGSDRTVLHKISQQAPGTTGREYN